MDKEIDKTRYKKYSYFKKIYKIKQKTLYNYGTEGLIRFIRENNKRYYLIIDVKRYIDEEFTNPNIKRKENICYGGIFKNEDMKFLEEQVKYFETNFPSYEIIYDI